MIINSKITVNNNKMHQNSLHSTSILSKTHSQIKLPASHIHHTSPLSRPFSSRQKQHTHQINQNNMEIMLHESLITKNKKLSIMIKSIHTYMVNIQELDWIITQMKLLMENYIRCVGDKGGPAHKIQIDGLYQEMVKLAARFGGIDKKWVWEMTVPLKDNRKIMNMSRNSENYNLMNFRKTETIGSFKCTDTQNQEQGIHTDFSKIKLPQIIKQHQIEQNMQSSRHGNGNGDKNKDEVSLKQYEAAIQMLKQELEKEKKLRSELKLEYQDKIQSLNKKIGLCHSEWETYKTYASCCIHKCKKYLADLNQQYPHFHNVQPIFDQLFSIQSRLDRRILDCTPEDITMLKQQKLKQLLDMEQELKSKRQEIDKLQTQRINMYGHPKNNTNTTTTTATAIESELIKLLYIQATTIQHLI